MFNSVEILKLIVRSCINALIYISLEMKSLMLQSSYLICKIVHDWQRSISYPCRNQIQLSMLGLWKPQVTPVILLKYSSLNPYELQKWIILLDLNMFLSQ